MISNDNPGLPRASLKNPNTQQKEENRVWHRQKCSEYDRIPALFSLPSICFPPFCTTLLFFNHALAKGEKKLCFIPFHLLFFNNAKAGYDSQRNRILLFLFRPLFPFGAAKAGSETAYSKQRKRLRKTGSL